MKPEVEIKDPIQDSIESILLEAYNQRNTLAVAVERLRACIQAEKPNKKEIKALANSILSTAKSIQFDMTYLKSLITKHYK